jgi:hypothetical protein
MLSGVVNDLMGTRWVFVAGTLVILAGALAFILRTAGRPIVRFVEQDADAASAAAPPG